MDFIEYDPNNPIDPAEWLAIDEGERLYAVQCWVSSRSGEEPEDCMMHAVPILTIENQIAGNQPEITRATLDRLVDAGVDRLTAVAVMAGLLYESLQRMLEDGASHDAEAFAEQLRQLDPEEIKAGVVTTGNEPDSLSTVPHFAPEHRQALVDFGERYADDGAMTYEETAGFLFAIVACPELVMPSQWTDIVQGDAEFDDVAEAEAVMHARMALMNWVSDCIWQEEPAIPEDCRPGPDPIEVLETDNPFSRWSCGFTTGHQWLEEPWSEAIAEDSEEGSALGSALVVLTFFSGRELAEVIVAEAGSEVGSVDEAAELFHPMIEAAIHDYAAIGLEYRRTPASPSPQRRREPARSQKVGRNQPCPCGSGKKYKKCCGRPGTVH